MEPVSEKIKISIDTAEITNRTYSQYEEMFGLGEEAVKGKQILDLAAGLSNFTHTVNQRYADSGTQSRSIDVAYSLLASLGENADYHSFQQKVHEQESGSFGASDYSPSKNSEDWEQSQRVLSQRMQEMRRERHQSQDEWPQIAAAAQALPYKSDSFDLVLSSNFLLYPVDLNRNGNDKLLYEAIRVIKENGELRIYPAANFMIDHKTNTVRLSKATQPGTADKEAEKIFSFLSKEKGIHFYLVDHDDYVSLVLTKDDHIPRGFSDDQDVIIRRLNIEQFNPDTLDVPFNMVDLKPQVNDEQKIKTPTEIIDKKFALTRRLRTALQGQRDADIHYLSVLNNKKPTMEYIIEKDRAKKEQDRVDERVLRAKNVR
jgi:ubiquinone/menaquinone biosynthesis C-methylase UbiE